MSWWYKLIPQLNCNENVMSITFFSYLFFNPFGNKFSNEVDYSILTP